MTLFSNLRKALQSVADPKKAPQMRAYMKSEMPYHGVTSPELRKVTKEIFKDLSFKSEKEWQKTVRDIWHRARFREERYGALHLCAAKPSLPFQTPKVLPLYEELIVSGAWWDYVDDIATHRLTHLVSKHPMAMKGVMLAWSKCDNLWKRRSSILCQLSFKGDTDLDFLYRCIEPSIDSSEFFLRKAIGWALRSYAWHNPREVKRYVKENEDRLSSLSQREALKNVGR